MYKGNYYTSILLYVVGVGRYFQNKILANDTNIRDLTLLDAT
jgi:hypothetical protein